MTLDEFLELFSEILSENFSEYEITLLLEYITDYDASYIEEMLEQMTEYELEAFIDEMTLILNWINQMQEITQSDEFESFLQDFFIYFADSMEFDEWEQDGHFSISGQGQTANIISAGDIDFITITTASGNHFFLVIDRTAEYYNVHFLSTVSEIQLLALADVSVELGIHHEPPFLPHRPTAPPAPAIPGEIVTEIGQAQPAPPEAEAAAGGPNPWMPAIFFILAFLVFGLIKFRSIKKKNKSKDTKKRAENNANDAGEDDYY